MPTEFFLLTYWKWSECLTVEFLIATSNVKNKFRDGRWPWEWCLFALHRRRGTTNIHMHPICQSAKTLDWIRHSPTLHHPHLLLTLPPVWVCMNIWASVCDCQRALSLSLPSTWMGAVSEMEVLMISVLEENHSQSPLPGECRFYDSDFHKSEVTSTHIYCWATKT